MRRARRGKNLDGKRVAGYRLSAKAVRGTTGDSFQTTLRLGGKRRALANLRERTKTTARETVNSYLEVDAAWRTEPESIIHLTASAVQF
jgi:hypothetical protein